ncbi:monovalent cation/H(+) antiporter subunit G [Rhizobium sp.]|uniref:monovalent cation/H(+) antiporter subunit G n=1 Tax=Rhizobium sp. TaxID=391 RepID=UPI00289B0043
MMELVVALLTSALVLSGAAFALVAAIGLNRLPDIYSRMHAASKAGTVGSGLLLLAVGLQSGEIAVLARALAGFFFFVLTAPVSAHLLAMASLKAGYSMANQSVCSEMPVVNNE